MGETKKKNAFRLPNEKVNIRFIKHNIGIAANVKDNHILSGGMLEGATRKFPAPPNRSGGLKNILTDEEKEFFEEKVFKGQNLSMYGKFWDNRYVTLGKLGTILDLSVPDDYLKYKMLLGWNTIIAGSLDEHKNHPSLAHQFYMERAGEEDRYKSKSLSATKQAWKNFNKIEGNREVLSAVIFLMSGSRVADNASLEHLNSKVEQLVDGKADKFNELLADSQFETKVLIANAERSGVIKKVKGAYETKDGLPITQKGQPATVQNVVSFLNDPLNNEVLQLIQSRVDNIKE